MTGVTNVLWQKNPELAWREIEEETVIISPNESVMHELNDTGSFVWRNIDGKRSTGDLAAMLATVYKVTPATALADTEALLQELSLKQLIVPSETGAGGTAE